MCTRKSTKSKTCRFAITARQSLSLSTQSHRLPNLLRTSLGWFASTSSRSLTSLTQWSSKDCSQSYLITESLWWRLATENLTICTKMDFRGGWQEIKKWRFVTQISLFSNFIPFIPILKSHCDVLALESGIDYRSTNKGEGEHYFTWVLFYVQTDFLNINSIF